MRFIIVLLTITVIFSSTSAFANFPGQNGKILFNVLTPGVSRIATINPDGSGETILTQGPSDFIARWSPDGSRIVFSGSSDIFIMNADGSNLRQLTFGSGYNRYPTFSPDGTRIVYVKGNLGLWQVNADGTGGEVQIVDLAFDIHYLVLAFPHIACSALMGSRRTLLTGRQTAKKLFLILHAVLVVT